MLSESLVCFLLTPKHVTLNDLKWTFYVKFCFYACKDCGFWKKLHANYNNNDSFIKDGPDQ